MQLENEHDMIIPSEKPESTQVPVTCWQTVLALALLPVCCILTNGILGSWFFKFRIKYLPANILMYIAIPLVLYMIFHHMRIALSVTAVTNLMFMIICDYVYRFRDRYPITADLMSIKSALAVADSYDYTPDLEICIACILNAAYLFLIWKKLKGPHDRIYLRKTSPFGSRMLPGLLMGSLFCLVMFGPIPMRHETFYPTIVGLPLNFLSGIRLLKLPEPEGYGLNITQSTASRYAASMANMETQPENIIVIMDESFMDLSSTPYYDEYSPNIDIYENLHAIQSRKDVISGFSIMPVHGGGTSQSEWEVITGMSYSAVSSGSIPYLMYMNDRTPSLAKIAASQGYKTISFHTYKESCWGRVNAYECLGFMEQYYEKDLPGDARYIGAYASDQAHFEFIENLTEENDGKTFIWSVTMQNHSGYSPRFETYDVTMPYRLEVSHPWVKDYYNLIHETDLALKQLIEYYDQCEEPTMILFFGDHWPSLGTITRGLLFGRENEDNLTLEDIETAYHTPFFVYTNYGGLPELPVQDTSANYLSLYITEYSGLPNTAFLNYLSELKTRLPSISTYVTKDRLGDIYSTESLPDSLSNFYKEYATIIYDALKNEEQDLSYFFQIQNKN